jgi:hypothetical protein
VAQNQQRKERESTELRVNAQQIECHPSARERTKVRRTTGHGVRRKRSGGRGGGRNRAVRRAARRQ